MGHLLQEANASGTVQRDYIWLDDMPVAMVDDTCPSCVIDYIHTDQLDTPQKMTDGSASIVWDKLLIALADRRHRTHPMSVVQQCAAFERYSPDRLQWVDLRRSPPPRTLTSNCCDAA